MESCEHSDESLSDH